jgi:hypothetical protein
MATIQGREARITFEIDGRKVTIGGEAQELIQERTQAIPTSFSISMEMDLDECSRARLRAIFSGYPKIPSHVKCADCDGEGGHESGILCGGFGCKCDGFSGGCTEGVECETCEGACEVALDPDEQCHAHPSGEHCDHCGDVDAEGKDLACCFCGFKVAA